MLSASDSAYLKGGTVFRDCAVDQPARQMGRETPIPFTPSTTPRAGTTDCYYAEVEFVVSATGVPETETVTLGRTNDSSFGQAVLASVSSWRYRPADKGGAPVRQIVRERKVAAVAVTVSRAGQRSPPPPPPNCR